MSLPDNDLDQDQSPSTPLFPDRAEIAARAVFLGQRIDLKAVAPARRLPAALFAMHSGKDGYAVLFRYGVAVLFGMDALEQANFLKELTPWVIAPFEQLEEETVTVTLATEDPEGAGGTGVRFKVWDAGRLQLLAHVLAKSAVLSYYEIRIAETFERIEPIAADMQNGAPSGRKARDLLQHFGNVLSIQRQMIGQVEIEDKPDILWDMPPELERLHGRLEDEFEIRERHNVLLHKLELIHRTAETMLGLLQDRRSLHVEWYIVILIVIEILLTLGERFSLF